jgi:hypothetical protein
MKATIDRGERTTGEVLALETMRDSIVATVVQS